MVLGRAIRIGLAGVMSAWLALCLVGVTGPVAGETLCIGADGHVAVGPECRDAGGYVTALIQTESASDAGCAHCPSGGRCVDIPTKGLLVRPRASPAGSRPVATRALPYAVAFPPRVSSLCLCPAARPPACSRGLYGLFARIAAHASVVLRL